MPLISIELLNTHKEKWEELCNNSHSDLVAQGFGVYMNMTYCWMDNKLAKIKDTDDAYAHIKQYHVKREI
tara:strand:- start:155 stop:364 length:210 start_codon:yes stop_codon:yes gene_type:complete